jgi:DNA-binding HxlR family transcriptional regulator
MLKLQKIETNRDNCPIQLTNKLLGDRWILLILRELFLGHTRFDEFEKNLAISKSVLSVKLKGLVNNNLITKTDYREEKKRTRSEYHLTTQGSQLIFIMGAIMDWGNANLVNQEEQFLKMIDKNGGAVRLAFLNNQDEELALKDLQFELS